MGFCTRLVLRLSALGVAVVVGTGVAAHGGITNAVADTDLGCPRGASPSDAAIAGQLNVQLTGRMRGHLRAGNVACARVIAQTVKNRGLSAHAATIAITTTIVESSIRNLDYGDASSVGLFQQIDAWGSFAQRTDPVWATNAFLGAMLQQFPDGSWATRPVGEVCQAVQRSAFPGRYQPEAADGGRIAAVLWNGLNRRVDREFSGDNASDLMTIDTNGKLYYYPNSMKANNGVPFTGAAWSSPTGSWGGVKKITTGDISGDRYADVMAVDANGKLYYYPNNAGVNGGKPVTSATWSSPAATWGGVKHITAGDVSGDGAADLMAVDADGKLYYYPNNAGVNGGKPVTSAAWASGAATWGGVKHMSAADFSGDGAADLVVVDADGRLYYYPNNMNVNGGVPVQNAAWVSETATWGNVQSIAAGDYSGDGFADLMVVDADGKLYYYPNNAGVDNGVLFRYSAWASPANTWNGNRLAG